MQTTIPQSLYSAMRFNFLYVDKYTFHSGWFFPEDYIPYCLLRFITRGEAVFKINSEEIAVHKNEIVYIPEGAVMSCWALSDNVEFYSIRFCVTARLNDSDFLGEYFHIPTVTKNVQENVLTYFQEIYQSATSQNPSRLFRIRGNLELIIAYLTQCANAECEGDGSSHDRELPDVHSLEAIRRRNAKTQNINRDPRIQIVVDYLTPHLNEQFTIQSLSEMAQVSQTSFRRLFKAHTGKSPSDYSRITHDVRCKNVIDKQSGSCRNWISGRIQRRKLFFPHLPASIWSFTASIPPDLTRTGGSCRERITQIMSE